MTDKLPFKLPKPDDKHFYDILNCAPSSTAAQIKAEFYSKARGAHPDKTGHAVGADENKCNDTEIARLNRAYDVLSDPEKRAKYDKYLESELEISWEAFCDLGAEAHESVHWASKAAKPSLTAISNVDAGVAVNEPLRTTPYKGGETNKEKAFSPPYVPQNNRHLHAFRRGEI